MFLILNYTKINDFKSLYFLENVFLLISLRIVVKINLIYILFR